MDKKETKELINLMNRHKSIKDVHLEVIASLSGLQMSLAQEELREFIPEECAHVLVGVQRIIEEHNCTTEVQKLTEEILVRYRDGQHER